MALNSTIEEIFVHAPAAPRTNGELGDLNRTPSWASPEEGLRLIRDFLRIERPALRARVFELVAEILRVQEEG
jgi:hypothetical protein